MNATAVLRHAANENPPSAIARWTISIRFASSFSETLYRFNFIKPNIKHISRIWTIFDTFIIAPNEYYRK